MQYISRHVWIYVLCEIQQMLSLPTKAKFLQSRTAPNAKVAATPLVIVTFKTEMHRKVSYILFHKATSLNYKFIGYSNTVLQFENISPTTLRVDKAPRRFFGAISVMKIGTYWSVRYVKYHFIIIVLRQVKSCKTGEWRKIHIKRDKEQNQTK